MTDEEMKKAIELTREKELDEELRKNPTEEQIKNDVEIMIIISKLNSLEKVVDGFFATEIEDIKKRIIVLTKRSHRV